MSGRAVLLTADVILLIALAGALAYIWRQNKLITELTTARHAKPRARGAAAAAHPDGGSPALSPAGEPPGPVEAVRVAFAYHQVEQAARRADGNSVPPAQAAAHADALRRAADPWFPERGEHPYPPLPRRQLSRADLPVTPVDAGPAPWTGQQPVLDEAALAELDRRQYVRAHMAESGTPTRDDLERAATVLREPVYGEKPVADVIEAERLGQVMMP